MNGFIIDATAVRRLCAGDRTMSRMLSSAHKAADRRLYVPALCLAAAEVERAGTADHVGSLPAIEITSLDLSDASVVGRLIRRGVDWRTAHAVVAGRPTVDWPHGRPVVTASPEAYDGHHVATIHVKD